MASDFHVVSASAGLGFPTPWPPQGRRTQHSGLGLQHTHSREEGRSGFTFSDLALEVRERKRVTNSPSVKGAEWTPHLSLGGLAGALLVEQPVLDSHC